jgi:hypothetical protein
MAAAMGRRWTHSCGAFVMSTPDAATAGFKTSAQEFLDRADAVVLHDGADHVAWAKVSLKPVAGKPMFRIRPPQYVTPELVEFVRKKIRH